MNRNINIIGDKDLYTFLQCAPKEFREGEKIKKFQLKNGDYIHCVLWNMHFYITGTDIVKILVWKFNFAGRQITSPKKFEEGVFSDLRNLKPGIDATLERPRSEFLEFLYKNGCIRTQKKQKVFFWYSVPHEALFCDAMDRDVRRESSYINYSKFMNTYGVTNSMENLSFNPQHMDRPHFRNRHSATLKKKHSVNLATRSKSTPPQLNTEYCMRLGMQQQLHNLHLSATSSQQPQHNMNRDQQLQQQPLHNMNRDTLSQPPMCEMNTNYLDYSNFPPVQENTFPGFSPEQDVFNYDEINFCDEYNIGNVEYGNFMNSYSKDVPVLSQFQMPEVFTPPKNEVVVTEDKNYIQPSRAFMPNIPNTGQGKPQK